MVDPHFAMLWHEAIPRHAFADAAGRATQVVTYAGTLEGGTSPPPPPPHSWAAAPENGVAVWTIKLDAKAQWELPAAAKDLTRTLYLHRGVWALIGGQRVPGDSAVRVRSDAAISLEAGDEETELLLLQGRPIGEPVAQMGPFVMNEHHQIGEAIMDYRRGTFGSWPWPSQDPVHARERGRFAVHADGREELK